MKGCFVLQRRFAYLGHELAILLKGRGVDEFCAYAHMRESSDFLKSQGDIGYKSIMLDEEIQKLAAASIALKLACTVSISD
jgi:hypothetical protein